MEDSRVEHYVGIDVSLELSSVCVVDGRGKIVKEAKVASEPEALVYCFKELGFPVNRIGFEAGPYYALDGYCSESHLGWRSNMKLLRTNDGIYADDFGRHKSLSGKPNLPGYGSQKA